MWRINARFPNGAERTYTLKKMPFERIPDIVATAEDENIYLQIYRVDGEKETLLFNSIFLQVMAEVVKDDMGI